jgi:hypothetical protein
LPTTTSIQLVRLAIAAAEAKIGMEELVRRLKAPESTVRAWRDGHGAIPQKKFVLLIEVMTDVDPHWKPE